jgi:hypothetical protein
MEPKDEVEELTGERQKRVKRVGPVLQAKMH